MYFLKIFAIIIFFGINFLLNGDAFWLDNGIELRLPQGIDRKLESEIFDYARELEKSVDKLLFDQRKSSKFRYVIVFSSEKFVFPYQITFAGKVRTITIYNFSGDDLNFRKSLADCLLSIRLDKNEFRYAVMPDWVFAGLDARVQKKDNIERPFSRSRYLPGLRGLLDLNCLPSLDLLMQMDFRAMDEITYLSYRQYCRFILELCVASGRSEKINVMNDYMLKSFQSGAPGKVFAEVIKSFLLRQSRKFARFCQKNPEKISEKDLLKSYLDFFARKIAFYYINPMSASQALQQFNLIRRLDYDEFDADGKPTGKSVKCRLEDLPEIIGKYPHGDALKLWKIDELTNFRGSISSIAIEDTNRLLKVLANVQKSFFFGTSSSELHQALEDVQKSLETQLKIETFMRQSEIKNISPCQVFYYDFLVMDKQKNTESSGIKKFLDNSDF